VTLRKVEDLAYFGKQPRPIIRENHSLRAPNIAGHVCYCRNQPQYKQEPTAMESITSRRALRIGILFAILISAGCLFQQARARGQEKTPAPQFQTTRVTVLDDAHVTVTRNTFPAGSREAVHTSSVPSGHYALLILVTPGQFEVQADDKKMVLDKSGAVWEIPPAPSQLSFANLTNQPLDAPGRQAKVSPSSGIVIIPRPVPLFPLSVCDVTSEMNSPPD
jgi:quercetin dioxygenase-like cupin family protein